MALNIKDLGVKFYSSKTKEEAIALATLPNGAAEPGAICFVSDNTGNYIILNGRIFGDGTSGGGGGSSGGSGTVDSVNGKTGVIVLTLSDFPVIEQNGTVLKTLQDYFKADGTLISNSFEVSTQGENPFTIFKVNESTREVTVNGNLVATLEYVTTAAGNAYNNAITYTNNLLTNIYVVKGSVHSYSDLPTHTNENVQNRPKGGWVYNVETQYQNIPAGTNYVYVSISDSQDPKYPGYWDPLGGATSVDLSGYVTYSEFLEFIGSLNSTIQSLIETEVGNLVSSINDLISAINTNLTGTNGVFDLLNNHNTRITNNYNSISNLATQLTWQ